MNFHYLRTAHKGDTFWLNCALISKDRLGTYVNDEVKEVTSPGSGVNVRVAEELVDTPSLT